MTAPAPDLTHQLCRLSASLFARGLVGGGAGNISVRTPEGFLVTPTGSSLGTLDPGRLSRLAPDGTPRAGDPPSKEWPLHAAFYDTRPSTGAVVHLHSTWATALSLLSDTDPENALPPISPYAIMRLGKVRLLPFFVPGDPAMGEAVRALGGRHAAVLLANHGPVVSAPSLQAAVDAMEEFEETAKLALITRGLPQRRLTAAEIGALVARHDVEWDA